MLLKPSNFISIKKVPVGKFFIVNRPKESVATPSLRSGIKMVAPFKGVFPFDSVTTPLMEDLPGPDSIVTDDAYMNGPIPDNNNSKLKKSIDLFMII